MASPIAHSLTGFAIYSVWRIKNEPRPSAGPNWRLVALFALLANLPDFDFLLGWLFRGNPNAWHHTWSHSIPVSMVTALLAARVCPLPGGWLASARVFFLLIGSHLILDYLSGPDIGANPSYPMPLLAPFSADRFRAPFTLFSGVEHSATHKLFGLHNALCALYEIALFTPLALVTWFATNPRREPAGAAS